MGQYTQFRFIGTLKRELPAEEIDLLKKVIISGAWQFKENGKLMRPDIANKFFDCPRWLSLLTAKDFDEERFSHFSADKAGNWVLDIYSAFKNYDHEIDYFLDWIAPYLVCTKAKENLGWYQHEFDEKKTFIDYLPKEKVFVLDQTAERGLNESLFQ